MLMELVGDGPEDDEEGVEHISAEKGNLVALSADETWYASESWTVPAHTRICLSSPLPPSDAER